MFDQDTETLTETPYIIMENGIPFHAKVIGLPFFRIPKNSNAKEKAKPQVKLNTI